jgi:predicted metal-dependent phosphoesterase TrpH
MRHVRLDFHLHTHCSDGSLHPSELLAAVRASRLEHWAVTDHDTMAGWRALRDEAGLVPGVEVTSEVDGHEVHIVGLGVDPEDQAFADFLAGIRSRRVERLQAIIVALGEAARLSPAELGGGTADSLSRYHLAKALVGIGRAPHVSAAFTDLIGDAHCAELGLPPYPTPAAACVAIRAAGGVAILAHPGLYGTAQAVAALLDHGLDGLETSHSNLNPDLALELRDLAEGRRLLESCGSDIHWLGARQPGDHRLDRGRALPLLRALRLAA